MLKPTRHTPKLVPVTVYRASDNGAPKLKAEVGSLKTLLKACLVNGYGDKAPLGWQMTDESNTKVIFHSKDPESYGFGLKVDNTNHDHIKAYMVGGEKFDMYMGYNDYNYNSFSYYNNYAMSNWLLVGHSRAFVLALPGNDGVSQILYFGDVAGLFEDKSNTVYMNTSFRTANHWDTGDFIDSSKLPVMPASQYYHGSRTTSDCSLHFLFSRSVAPFPDALYTSACASAIVLSDQTSPRAFLSGLGSSFHDLQSLPELSDVVLIDGKRYAKLTISDGFRAEAAFVLNLEEWEL